MWLPTIPAALCLACVFALLFSCEQAQNSPTEPTVNTQLPQTGQRSVLDEVVENIQRETIGDHTVADLNLPADFLRRAADRILRTSFEDRFRIIVHDKPQPATALASGDDPAPELHAEAAISDAFRVVKPDLSLPILQYRQTLNEARPPLPGFRAPVLSDNARTWPFEIPNVSASPQVQQAATLVGHRLARDGLLFTLAQAIHVLGPQAVASMESADQVSDQLRAIGVPVDWLDHFDVAGVGGNAIPHWIAKQLSGGRTVESLRPALSGSVFSFHPSRPGFRVSSESGEHDIAAVRMQMSRGTYWEGIGDGGNMDLARQMVARLPKSTFLIRINQEDVGDLIRVSRSWPDLPQSMLLMSSHWPVAQWAQDNGKGGFVDDSRIATIVPRFASRGEIGSTFVPGEAFVADEIASAGCEVFQSPLLFQGGNLLTVKHPVSGERILLIGEAEVYRNIALGLTHAQTLDAFRAEFGVDRCEVLPSVSFHIDFDLTVRAQGDRLIAFVADPLEGSRIILARVIDVLESNEMIDAQYAAASRLQLRNSQWREFLQGIGQSIVSMADANGRFLFSLAEYFRGGERDSAVGNFQRLLLALDTIASVTLTADDLARNSSLGAYLESLGRAQQSRAELHRRLKTLGMEVVTVPCLADGSRGIHPLNGIHTREMYMMPVYGGLFAALDQAAANAFSKALGPSVQIQPIQTAESQRRAGALHCSVSVLYRP